MKHYGTLSLYAVCVCLLLTTQIAPSLARSDVVELTAKNFDKLVLKSNDVWMVEFFAPWCGHCKSLAPKYEQLASKTKGVVRVGAVDATVHQSLGQRYGVRGYPTLKVFDFGKKAKKNPEDYQGAREVRAMKNALYAKLRNFATKLTAKTHDSYVESNGDKPIAILFTSKKTTTPLYKSLSMRYKNKISLTEVHESEKALVDKYFANGAPSLPALVVIKPGGEVVHFEGKIGAATVTSFLDKQVPGKDGSAGSAGEASDDAGAPPPPPPMPPLKPRPRKAKEITSAADFTKHCMSKARCILASLDPKSDSFAADKETIDNLANKYKRDPLSFVWVNAQDQASLVHGFNKDHSPGAHSVVAVNGKRKKVAVPAGGFDRITIDSFLDKVLGGDVTFAALEDVPEWNVEGGASGSEDEELCTKPPEDGGECGGN